MASFSGVTYSVAIDRCSGWLIVLDDRKTKLPKCLRSHFAAYRVQETITTDGRPQFKLTSDSRAEQVLVHPPNIIRVQSPCQHPGRYCHEVDEEADGTDPTNPDTDGDGMCDGSVASPPHCVAGPDAFPLDPSADTDTDGDGDPDTLNPPSTSVPALVEDLDDDGDGLEDIYETDTGVYNGATDTGTDPLDPDTDNDGICDGPIDVLPIWPNIRAPPTTS